MKKSAHIVVGLGYGDEGKGSKTNHLCQTNLNPIVIRFNGGHQAGHTVVLQSGERHVFSSFGSGTFLSIPTYWSSYCTVSPAHLLAEYHTLEIIPKLYLDNLCPVTTHYDVLYNRALENTKGDNRNGSCGMGFGATIDRHFKHKLEFHFQDLLDTRLIDKKLELIKTFYRERINNETKYIFENFNHDLADKIFKNDVMELNDLIERMVITTADEKDIFKSKEWETYIFEGAQGILLDQSFGKAPHITKSNTSSKNAIEILKRNFQEDSNKIEINLHYISRSYLTRHGAGPFPTHRDQIRLINTENETNINNEYQGSFRTGFLNIELLNYAIECDNQFSSNYIKHLTITCLDQLNEQKLTIYYNNKLETIELEELVTFLKERFKTTKFSYNAEMTRYIEM